MFQEAKELLGDEKLADTRQETKVRNKKTPLKKATTVSAAVAEGSCIGAMSQISKRTELSFVILWGKDLYVLSLLRTPWKAE